MHVGPSSLVRVTVFKINQLCKCSILKNEINLVFWSEVDTKIVKGKDKNAEKTQQFLYHN